MSHAKDNNLWLILTSHYIGNETEITSDTSLEDFRQTLECIKDSKIEVKTIREVIDIQA